MAATANKVGHTPSEYELRLRSASEVYSELAFAVAAEVREKHVVPFCVRSGLTFDTGNGSWSFGGDFVSQPEGMTDDLYNLLCMDVPLFEANDIGSLMDSFDPRGGYAKATATEGE